MISKHLQYETSKTVMQYLDANLRFKIAQHTPTLRSIERIVPLQIRKLEIGDANIVINGTKYTFSVHRESLDGSKLVSELDCDYDEFGFPMYPGRINVLPGDIDLRDARGLPVHWKYDTDRDERHYRSKLQDLNEQRQKEQGQLYFSYQDQTYQKAIEGCKAELAPFDTRRKKTPLPYIPSLQLTIESPDGKKHIQRAPYTLMLYENMKKLSIRFFGSQNSIVQVGTLVISARDCILRFPVDLKVHIRNLKFEIRSGVSYNILNYSALAPLIITPLNSLDILVVNNDFQNLEHKFVKEAKELIIGKFRPHSRLLDTWKNLKNQKVHLKYDMDGTISWYFNKLIDHWMLEGKPVGSCYTFEIDSVLIYGTVSAVEMRPEVIEQSESSVTLPMKNGSKLVISSEIQRNASRGVLKIKVNRSRQ